MPAPSTPATIAATAAVTEAPTAMLASCLNCMFFCSTASGTTASACRPTLIISPR